MRRLAFCISAFAAVAVCASRFELSESCALCHSQIGEAGQYRLWKQSMMAHAAQDPFWAAKVKWESAIQPQIEDKCLRCHAPAQQYEHGRAMKVAELNLIGLEGVTCTVCHQIGAGNLGRRDSFTGGFVIGDDRKIFGPHPEPFRMPMLHHTQYTPVEGKHILEAALCGTCHTVITEPKPGMEFIEQAPFLEWRASSYPAQGRTCQKCHLPDLRKPEYIAHRRPGGPFPPTRPRSPFGLHSFLGANVQGLRMLGQNQAAEQTSTFLRTALTLAASIRRAGEHIEVAVLVSNNTGHKLPTGFPSRRLWLHFRATAAEGAMVFESGAPDRVTEGQPHLQVITSAEQAIVYESEYEDLNGRPTVSLVRAARYRKDNRILPRGFAEERGPDVLPVGIRGDADFGPGSDMVVYRFRTEKPCRVTVDALYQSIRPSHAQGLTEFREKYRPYSGPVIIARAEAAE